MIADLKPYAEYKESGLPWLGRVPGHWDVQQARHIGRLLKGVGGAKEDAVAEGLPCVRYGELYTTYEGFIRTTKTFIKPDLAPGYMPIYFGDVLFAASGEKIEEIGKSAVNLMKASAVCGGDVIVLRPSIPVHAPYLGYTLDCRHAANQKSTMSRGTTIKHIYPDELRGLTVILPPPAEQAAIVRYLDWATGAGDPGEAEGDRAAGRAEAGHHPPRRHPRPRPLRPPQTLRHPVAWGYSAALGGNLTPALLEGDRL